MAEYRFKTGARVTGVKPAVVARELKRLEKTGRLQPPDVLDAARPETSPLHPAFEWDDGEAAEQFRLIQARQLIRAVVVISKGQTPRSVYVHVQSDENHYEPMEVVVRHQDRYTLALLELERRLRSAQEAIEELQHLASRTDQPDVLARINLAARAFEAAREAVHNLQ
jgi:hypothetical protein